MEHYLNLGVTHEASTDEIKQAYKKLSLKYHPDKNPDGQETFKQINASYKILSDDHLRIIYDYGYLEKYLSLKPAIEEQLTEKQILLVYNIFKDNVTTNYTKSDLLNDLNNKDLDKVSAILIKAYVNKDAVFEKNYINIVLSAGLYYFTSWLYDIFKRALPYAIFGVVGYYGVYRRLIY
jgi:curved DNA-binding protein CbpA